MNAPVMWSGPPAGCAPPNCFDPAQLLQCYCDIQATTKLISTILNQLLASDPATQAAVAEAVAKSGGSAAPIFSRSGPA